MSRVLILLGLVFCTVCNAEEPIPPASELHQRRARIELADSTELLIVVAGGAEGEEVLKDYEYLTGLRSWGGILILERIEGENQASLFLPRKDPGFELWHGPRAAPDAESRRLTGIDNLHPHPSLNEWLVKRSERIDKVLIAAKDSFDQEELLKVLGSEAEVSPAWRRLHSFRQIKSEWEVEQLRRAIGRTHRGLMKGAGAASASRHEWEIEAAIEGSFRSEGSPAPGFSSIVGSGERSCILHWQENNGELDRTGVLLMDVGARSGAYTADITRTVPVSGRWTDRQKEIYEVVLRAQAAGIAAVRPGATFRSIDAAARKVITDAGFGEFFPHGTSHHVGMDVHDVGPRRPLAPGMVITIEPGIYIAEEKLGIRIEDMVRVTESGAVILSLEIPKGAAEMEQWVVSGTDRTRPGRKNTPDGHPETQSPLRL